MPALASLPFASLHLGVGAHSDADNVGLGQRYISYRKRAGGRHAVRQRHRADPGRRAGLRHADAAGERAVREGLEPAGHRHRAAAGRAAAQEEPDRLQPGRHRRRQARRWAWTPRTPRSSTAWSTAGARSSRRRTRSWRRWTAGTGGRRNPAVSRRSRAPPATARTRTTAISWRPSHDQMIALIKLAFEWDLTRVVAITLSGASSGHRWPSQGVNKAHHTLEHSNDVAGLNMMGTYFAEKFARLLAALKGIDDGGGKTALYNSSVMLGHGVLEQQLERPLPDEHPVHPRRAGRRARSRPGRVVDAGGRNNNDLLISVQNASGIASSTFGLASLCKGPIIVAPRRRRGVRLYFSGSRDRALRARAASRALESRWSGARARRTRSRPACRTSAAAASSAASTTRGPR